jgi:hypothetical protein
MIGEGGMPEHRCVNVSLRGDAGLLRICRREGQRAASGGGRWRPVALVTGCQGVLENE